MKSISEKALKNKYAKACISESESTMLHKYLLCFTNLYGCIQIDDLWKVFKQYKEKITKEKFFNFVDIVQKEDNDFYVFNLNEPYTGETSTETKDKLLVNKKLVKRFEWKFWLLRRLEEYKDTRRDPYIPTKEELFKFDHDTFFESPQGKAMVSFVNNLKASGIERDTYKKKETKLEDLDGNSTKGRCLKDIVCHVSFERFQIEYYKKENVREYLLEAYGITCAEKVLNEIRRYIMIEDIMDVNESINRIMHIINDNYGVNLSINEAQEFLNLYRDLSNSANRWSMFGWSPNELAKITPISNKPTQLRIGPNMSKMIENGEYDLAKLEKMMKEKNINISFSSSNDNSDTYEDIMDENDFYFEEFRRFLEKRNYQEKIIVKHIDRVDYYINDYLMWGLPKRMQEGCSVCFINFIEGRVNECVFPPSVHNIDFFMVSIELFYECMAERKYITRKCLNEFKECIRDFKEEMVEDFYEKHPKEIEIYDVIEMIEFASGYGSGFMNVKTGEQAYVPEDESLYDGNINELYDKIDGPNWKQAPEIDDYRIMREFALCLEDKKQSKMLYEILKQKRAYANFVDAIIEIGIDDKYHKFYSDKIVELATEWMKENCEESNLESMDQSREKTDSIMH